MEELKFGADFIGDDGRIGGHIFITNDMLIWKPVKFLFFGNVDPIQIPINSIVGYFKDGFTLAIGVTGISTLLSFYTWKGQKIADAIVARNPRVRKYDRSELNRI